MKVWRTNDKNRLQKTILGSIPTRETLREVLGTKIPFAVEKVIEETHEDLYEIKKTFETLGVEVLTFPCHKVENSMNVRNFSIVIDDHLYITHQLDYLKDFYPMVENKTFLEHPNDHYCPDIFLHDDYVILDRLDHVAYLYWKAKLSPNRKVITAFNEGHSDGIYRNVADKIWLTNGNALPFQKHWPEMPVMDLSMSSGGLVNDWTKVEQWDELRKTRGRFVIAKQTMDDTDVAFVDDYLKNWIGYCEETIFDLNISVIDSKNVISISQNSLIYDRLESLGVKVHKVPFRHRFFWDGGLHCITNDLVREK